METFMKLFAILIATMITSPALAQEAPATAENQDQYFEVTPADEAKLEAVEKESDEAIQKAHEAAMKRAGVNDNTVDPYSVKLPTSPKENVIQVYSATKHEDRTGAVVTGTKAFLGK
jgi:hypothetical protein